jgi:hypothetical protein
MWVADCQHSDWRGYKTFPMGTVPDGCFILAVRYINRPWWAR